MSIFLETFYKELLIFLRKNYWIFFLFFACIISIWYTASGDIFEILLVFFLHFLGDICMMIMGNFYAKNERKKALYTQFLANIFFLMISFISFFLHDTFNYFLANIMFASAAIILFFRDQKKVNNFFTSSNFAFLINFAVLLVFIYGNFLDSWWGFIQVLGFFVFSFGLTIISEKKQYIFLLVGLFLQVLGSGTLMFLGFLQKNISGADVSFTLLPLVVFVYYILTFVQCFGKIKK